MSVLQSVQQIGSQQPPLLQHFKCLTPIAIQVIGPATLYVADNAQALVSTSDSGLIDALQLTNAMGIVTIWVQGDIYVAGSQPAVFTIYKPNVANAASGLGQGQGSGSGSGGV